ncbi:MAG: signal peptidase II [Steroidobacteraceae bacterium]
MSEARPPLSRSGWLWLPLSVAAILSDQFTKALIVARLQLHESVTVLPVLDILRAHNPGAAFSFLAGAGGWQRWFFTVLAIGVSVAILIWLRQLRARAQGIPAAGLALVLGGALGNVIDRLQHGYVVDFVHVHWKQHSFPAFNLADACITVGAGLLLLDTLLEWRRDKVK